MWPVNCESTHFNKCSQSYNLVLGIKKEISLNKSVLSGIKILSGLTTLPELVLPINYQISGDLKE